MGIFSKRTNGTVSAKADNGRLISDFILKSEGLQRILEKETEYFREMKTKQAEILIETKLSLIQEIETIKLNLISDPKFLRSLPEEEKKKLSVANNNLMKAAEENYNETLKAKEVNKLILEAIVDAISQSKRVDGAYGEKGIVYNSDDARAISIIENA